MYFLYFIPNGGTLDQKLLDGCGLGYLSAGKMVSRGLMANGPEGTGGVLIADNRLDSKGLYYRPAQQKWEKSLNGKFFVGYWLNQVPNERSLRREKQIDGHKVQLADGAEYLVPVARCFDGSTKLPTSIFMDAKGVWVGPVLPHYADFSRKAQSLWQYFAKMRGYLSNVETDLSTTDQFTLAAEALGFNYWIGADEINLLGLFTQDNFQLVTLAIIDGPTLLQWEAEQIEQLKKNAPGGTTEELKPLPDGENS